MVESIELSDINSSINNLPTVNFGPGAELLMNDKKTSSDSMDADINISDIENLEKELQGDVGFKDIKLDTIENTNIKDTTNEYHSSKSGLFNEDNEFKINIMDNGIGEVNLPKVDELPLNQETKPKPVDKTWDGFATFNDIPIGPGQENNKPQMSKEELLKEKFTLLRKLEDLERKGADLTKKYTMESSLLEMQGEYETLISEKEKSNSVKFQGKMMMAAITGLEFLNNKFDPFDIKLDGWAEQINESLDDYDEIFAELHEKYKSKAKMAPELKLMFQIGGGAIMLHMTNSMFKTSMPGMDDIMRENPELMEQFTRAAVDKMGDRNPGLSGFMNNIMQPDIPTPSGPPPPPPMRTSEAYGEPRTNRPDLDYGRGLNTEGISINESFDISNENENGNENERQERTSRPDMEGPKEINELLSGLKTKVSSDDNKDVNIDLTVDEKPKRKKKNRSDRNTISLNL